MFTYSPIGTCSRQILFDVDQDNKMRNVRFIGGCSGNLQGIAKLVEGRDINEVLNILNKKSGLLGMSDGLSSDSRDIMQAAAEGNPRAKATAEAFEYRVAKYIGAYTAAMNGVDAICFTAGIGENDKDVRKGICSYLGYLGIEIDDVANNVRGELRVISTADSKVKVMLLPTNEELAIARETYKLCK